MISSLKKEGPMAQLVVRRIEDSVKACLQRRARRNGRSMEEEVRDILRNAANEPEKPSGGLGSEIAALFAGRGLTRDIPELRGYTIKPPTFDE
jgi:plasmid stability protein